MTKKNFLAVILVFSLVFSNLLPAMAVTGGIVSIYDFSGGQGGTAASANMANTIYFGSYYQGANKEAGKTGVQWRVLYKDTDNKQMLLLSDKGLYADQFNADKTRSDANVWKNSEVRATLNDRGKDAAGNNKGFAGDAFEAEEWNAIKTTTNTDTDTEDKLFLLSETEATDSANNYGLSTGDARKSEATTFSQNVVMYDNQKDPYGDEATVWVNPSTQKCVWWLRSPGLSTDYAYIVSPGGGVINGDVDISDNAVRPAFNLNLESVLFASAAVGGKSAPAACGGAFGINTSYDGSDGWKLTIIDKNISTPTVTTGGLVQNGAFDVNKLAAKALDVSKTSGSKVINIGGEAQKSGAVNYIEYSEESTGENKFVSALLYESDGTTMKNYAKVASVGTSATKKGVFAVKAPTGEASSKLRFFAEEANGDCETDYASELTDLATVDWASESGTPNVTLSKDYAASGLTVDLFADAKLGFEAGNYDTSVIIDPNQTGIVTADSSGTTLTGDVTVNDSATLTMTNPFTLSGNLYANEGAKLSIADSLTMAQSGVVNFNSSGEDASARTSYKAFNFTGAGNFTANNFAISINTDLAKGAGDKIDMSAFTGSINGNARVMVAYDPCFKTNAGATGNHVFLALPSTSTKDTLKVTGAGTSYNGLLYTPTVAFDETNKNWQITAITTAADETSKAVSDGVNVVNFVWLETVNNVQKRLGELRGGEESDKAWARFQRSNDDYDGARKFNVSGNMYQVGYDFALKNQVASRGYFGVSFEAFDGTQSYKLGGGDVKSMSLGAYYTKIYDSGHYFDFILRYGRLENDSTSYDSSLLIPISTKLDYAMNSVTLSGEYGYRANLGKSGLYLEPQAEFIYGYLSGAQATSSTNILADIDSTNHFVTRLGLAFGQRVKNFNYYLRGSYYHDFAGTTHVKYGDASYKQDSAQNWWEVSLGGGWNISKLSYFYAELTKHFKDVSNSLNFNVGFRFTL